MPSCSRYGFLLLIILLLVVPILFPSANIVERLVGPPANWIIRALLPNSLSRRQAGFRLPAE